jgi:hypothetical protein
MNDYLSSTGDITTDLNQSKESTTSNGFLAIQDTDITQIAQQNQIAPRMIRTGTTRGDQQIKGVYTVVDENSTIRVEIGYDKSAF